MILRRTSAAVFSTLLLLGYFSFTTPLHAAPERPKFWFQQRPQVGESWTFDQTFDTQMNSSITSDSKVAEQMTQSMHQARSGTITVLTVGENGIDRMRIAFDPACVTTVEQTGQVKREVQFSLAGMTIVVKRRPSGELENDFKGELDQQTQNELAAMMEPDTHLYPVQPVCIGESWPLRKGGLERHFSLKPGDLGTGTCSLDSTKIFEGRPMADMIIGISLVKMEQGFIKTEVKLKGAARIDLSSGHTMAGVLDGPLVLSGSQLIEQKGRPVMVRVTGDGKMSFRSSTRWIAVAAPVAEAGNVIAEPVRASAKEAAHASPQGVLMAVGSASARLNPARPVKPQGDLTGTDTTEEPARPEPFNGFFRDENLRLDLTSAGTDVTGTIRLGAQRFPLRGKIESDKLTGTFENEGTPFSFTAKYEGSTLIFATDNTPYRLRRQKTNPLARTE